MKPAINWLVQEMPRSCGRARTAGKATRGTGDSLKIGWSELNSMHVQRVAEHHRTLRREDTSLSSRTPGYIQGMIARNLEGGPGVPEEFNELIGEMYAEVQ
ncbi:hypothetical protein TRAPUB_10934 [Trametes pubescens]|uniref:Uncharacterized protein n=1 Tax=Trametes pubescens TaxID=154538 RepID=A0A1M2VY81_TRAPU|nr:hypothetical protein TRAPUB_10934 [Trametes pubescens]